MTGPNPSRTALIIGAGPGIGVSSARRLAAEGAHIVLVARRRDRLDVLARELVEAGASASVAVADVTDFDELRVSLRAIVSEHGPPDTVLYCPLPRTDLIKPLRQTTAEDFAAAFALSVGGASVVVQEVLPAMLDAGRGRLLFTTGSGALRPSAERAASAIQTSAAGLYVQLLATELRGSGVEVAHLTIVGPVGPGARHEPDDVAAALDDLRRHPTTDAVLDDNSAPPDGRKKEQSR